MSHSKGNRVQLSFRVPDQKRKELEHWATDHDTTIQDMVTAGLDLLLAEPANPVTLADKLKHAYHRQGANERWHKMLDEVLDHGTERDRVGIQSNLEWAVNAIRSAGPPKRKLGGL